MRDYTMFLRTWQMGIGVLSGDLRGVWPRAAPDLVNGRQRPQVSTGSDRSAEQPAATSTWLPECETSLRCRALACRIQAFRV
jgi:hypothetical protein